MGNIQLEQSMDQSKVCLNMKVLLVKINQHLDPDMKKVLARRFRRDESSMFSSDPLFTYYFEFKLIAIVSFRNRI